MTRYLFIGERRSRTAIRRGWTWESGRLAARTLFAALEAAGLDPAEQRYTNAWRDDGTLHEERLVGLECLAADIELGRPWTIVALGAKAAAVLTERGIQHRALTHPAARGAIRKREAYQAHVRAVLLGGDG
jgi:hypothetical protein